LRADMKTRAEFYGKMKEIGVYTTNMILAFEDENGIGSEGDQRFVPVNWQPADDLMTGGEAQQQKAAAAGKQAGATGQQAPGSGGKSPASGENQKQSPANPPAPARLASSSAEIVEAFRVTAEHAFSMLAKKEINEARRAAKKPGEVMTWMEKFYEGFADVMTGGLTPLATLSLAIQGEGGKGQVAADRAAMWSRDWIESSREQLLAAMECKSEEWPNKSAAVLDAWERRAGEEASALAKIAKEW
jgi:hypothetical protein